MQAKRDVEAKLAEADGKNAALDQVCSIGQLSLVPADHYPSFCNITCQQKSILMHTVALTFCLWTQGKRTSDEQLQPGVVRGKLRQRAMWVLFYVRSCTHVVADNSF